MGNLHIFKMQLIFTKRKHIIQLQHDTYVGVNHGASEGAVSYLLGTTQKSNK